jgi:hypothetical protein
MRGLFQSYSRIAAAGIHGSRLRELCVTSRPGAGAAVHAHPATPRDDADAQADTGILMSWVPPVMTTFLIPTATREPPGSGPISDSAIVLEVGVGALTPARYEEGAQ